MTLLEARLKGLRYLPAFQILTKWTECDRKDFPSMTEIDVALQLRAIRQQKNTDSRGTAMLGVQAAIVAGANADQVNIQEFLPYPEVSLDAPLYLRQSTIQQLALIDIRSNGFSAWLDKKSGCFISETK